MFIVQVDIVMTITSPIYCTALLTSTRLVRECFMCSVGALKGQTLAITVYHSDNHYEDRLRLKSYKRILIITILETVIMGIISIHHYV